MYVLLENKMVENTARQSDSRLILKDVVTTVCRIGRHDVYFRPILHSIVLELDESREPSS